MVTAVSFNEHTAIVHMLTQALTTLATTRPRSRCPAESMRRQVRFRVGDCLLLCHVNGLAWIDV